MAGIHLVVPKPGGKRAARGRHLLLPTDPVQSAQIAGLRYVTDDGPGIRRRKSGKGFVYIGVEGAPVRDQATLDRIKSLVIPPAWTDVWICAQPNGHLQVTARDAKGRKQYRYHPQYRAVRDQTKYGRMLAFSDALPLIRKRVRQELGVPGLARRKVLATVVRLLETTLIRVGNEEYAKENNSFGLTTLRDEHVEVSGSTIKFKFRGKSGKDHDIELSDHRLAKIVKNCQDLPGEELFQYLDENGETCTIASEDVNEYLREITGQDFTAKDFRTWNGTVLAALALEACGICGSQTQTKKNIVAAVKEVAERLGNRPSTCRKYYVHPAILEGYTEGCLIDTLNARHTKENASAVEGLTPVEVCIVGLLKDHASRELKDLKPAV